MDTGDEHDDRDRFCRREIRDSINVCIELTVLVCEIHARGL